MKVIFEVLQINKTYTVDLEIIPIKEDIIFINNNRYQVIERIFDLNTKFIKLIIGKI